MNAISKMPMRDGQYRDYVAKLEPKLHEIVHAATIANGLIGDLISETPKDTGSSELYRINDDQANTAIYALGEVIGKARGLRDEWASFIKRAKETEDPLEGRAGDVIAFDSSSNIRRGWHTAMSEAAYGLTFSKMTLVYDVLRAMSDIALDASENHTGECRDLLYAIHDDLAHIRSNIGEYCISAAQQFSSSDEEDKNGQHICDGIALKEASYDPEGNAELIAAIAARWLQPKTELAQAEAA